MKLSEFEKLIAQTESWDCVPYDWCTVDRNGCEFLYWGNKDTRYLAFIFNDQYNTIKCLNCKKTFSSIGFKFNWHGNKHCVKDNI